MTVDVNISDDDLSASALVALVEAGEEVVLERGSTPVATLRKVDAPTRSKPRIGAYAHLGRLDDPYVFHGPAPEWEGWEDKDIFPK